MRGVGLPPSGARAVAPDVGTGAGTCRTPAAHSAMMGARKIVAAQRGRGGIGLGLSLARRLALRFAFASPTFDRIDAATELVARLLRRLARTRQARAGRSMLRRSAAPG